MMYFNTKSSTYYVDETNKLIWGGVLGDNQQMFISHEPVMVGGKAVFKLSNGQILRTSVVKKVVAH